jgi:hypothetical protein
MASGEFATTLRVFGFAMSPHVTRIEYEAPLDDSGQEWLRVRIWTTGGQVTRFVAQYETMLDGKPAPVARYDTAHGFAHFDLLDREGTSRAPKLPLDRQLSLDDALQLAVQDLRRHWRFYRRDF